MPLLRNKFQPYFPDPDSPNNINCGKEYCWPVQLGDKILTQFIQTPCNNSLVCDPEFDDYQIGAELLTNPSFTGSATGWTLGTGWNWVVSNAVEHVATYNYTLRQSTVGFVACQYYQIEVEFYRTAGKARVKLGDGIDATYSDYMENTGTYIFKLFYKDSINDFIEIEPSLDYVGQIGMISVKRITFDYWDPNCSWKLENGKACFIPDSVDNPLIETCPNYIDANKYYKVEFYLSTQDFIQVSISDINVFAYNGYNTFYVTPTISGVLQFSAPFSQSDPACISELTVYELKKDYTLELVSSSGISYDVSNSIEYFEDYVTINLDTSIYEIPDDCYTLKMYDYCIVTSDNLVVNGDFVNGYDNWTRNNGSAQYSIVSDQLVFKFSPFTQGYTDYISNGDFSSGTNWNFGTNWALSGNKAVHTPGSTATLYQTMTLPTPPLNVNYNYYVKFTVSSWTTGTITCKLGTNVNGTTYTWKGNDTFIQVYQPKQAGSVDIIFTPSSTFDGSIDDVAVVPVSAHSAFPIITNSAQPLFTSGNYQVEWENISSTNPNISVKFQINNGVPNVPYQSDIGLQSYSQSFYLNGSSVVGIANFTTTSPNYIQINYVVGEIKVDNIYVIKVEPFEATYESECIYYSSNTIPKSKLITAYCDQNALGFDFENTGFKLQHRSIIRSFNPEYKKADNYINSGTGNSRIVYSELEKYWKMDTDFASETFHDLMNVMLLCDHFLIGDTENLSKEYSTNGEEYTVAWNGDGSFNLAVGSVNLRIKNQGQIFNRHK